MARRRLVWVNVTANPTAEWVARQLTEALPWEEAPRHLIRDRDGVYGGVSLKRLCAMGIRDHPTAARSLWQNSYAEWLVGSTRREILDHTVATEEAHLRQILQCYAAYYNRARAYRPLARDCPTYRPIRSIGTVKSAQILGGLHHVYSRT